MECRECQELLDGLLVAELTPGQRGALQQHMAACPACARGYALAEEALATITPKVPLAASAGFQERVMAALSASDAARPEAMPRRPSRRVLVGVSLAAAALLIIGLVLPGFFRSRDGADFASAFSVLSQARAAEDRLFDARQIAHLVNEIQVAAVADRELAAMRWLPLVSLEASGKPAFHQLALPAEPGKGYTVQDEIWFEARTRRFARVLTSQGKVVWAASFDGRAVHSLDLAAGGARRVASQPVAKDFRAPESPASFLGYGAGLPVSSATEKEGLFRDAGQVVLPDGEPARAVRVGFPSGGPRGADDAYWLFTIRSSTKTIESMEFRHCDQRLLMVSRAKSPAGTPPSVGWDLAGLAVSAPGEKAQAGPSVMANMIMLNVSVEHMLAKADFPIYVFSHDPPWAGQRQITDILDIGSPPHRMFAITYRAGDGRHVVLLQSYSYNQGAKSKLKQMKVVYTAPSGVKVLSTPQDKWLAQILLNSSRPVLGAAPGKDVTAYLLETPSGTFPALAINGLLSDAELHGLVDMLVPAKP